MDGILESAAPDTIIATAVLGRKMAPTFRANYHLGWLYWRQDDHARATGFFEAGAERDLRSTYRTGYAFLVGEGVEIDSCSKLRAHICEEALGGFVTWEERLVNPS